MNQNPEQTNTQACPCEVEKKKMSPLVKGIIIGSVSVLAIGAAIIYRKPIANGAKKVWSKGKSLLSKKDKTQDREEVTVVAVYAEPEPRPRKINNDQRFNKGWRDNNQVKR